jgi:hypothetical protein
MQRSLNTKAPSFAKIHRGQDIQHLEGCWLELANHSQWVKGKDFNSQQFKMKEIIDGVDVSNLKPLSLLPSPHFGQTGNRG